jgi:hypothetical protein
MTDVIGPHKSSKAGRTAEKAAGGDQVFGFIHERYSRAHGRPLLSEESVLKSLIERVVHSHRPF